jgi:hypothetical protein
LTDFDEDTYGAFCRRRGVWRVPHEGYTRCWNSEIIGAMARTLQNPWRDFESSAESVFGLQREVVSSCLKQGIKSFKEIDRTVALPF